jgi:hypothetical protein
MIRLCLTIACLASAVALTQASAKDLSADPARSARPHAAKARHPFATKSASADDASLNDIRFSNPYAPPEGATVIKGAMVARKGDFPGYPYPAPKEPQAGLSISMQKDGGGHTTGGFGWNF